LVTIKLQFYTFCFVISLLPEFLIDLHALRLASLDERFGSQHILTIPAVSIVCYLYDIKLVLGLDYLSIVLLMLSLITVMLSLNSGRSNVVYGTVLLVNLIAFIYMIVFP
jgi:Ca2+:H+ antiporter